MPDDPRLVAAVTEFADELSTLVAAVLDVGADTFAARASEGEATHVIIEQLPPEGIPLTVAGEPLLRLMALYHCAWDHRGEYLAVRASTFAVSAQGSDEPLFRYDYIAGSDGNVPAAHLNVHGHRDELVFAMISAGRKYRGRPRSTATTKGRIPRLATFHFPVGGHRFRPSLEDVIEIVVREFGIDTTPDWEDAVRAGRAAWRNKQLRAAVRDDPEAAADALRRLGYAISWPTHLDPIASRAERVLAL